MKKTYIKPEVEVVELRQDVAVLLPASQEGMEEELQDEEVNEGW